MISSLLTLAGFVVNRNIFNSDNYRYLVCLLVPWSLGFGLAADHLFARGRAGAIVAIVSTLVFAVVMTADLARWYARFGWIDERGRPLGRSLDDPALSWLAAHPEIAWIDGSYWDVYRLSFLIGGRVRGVPFGVYPNRFPEWRPEPGEKRATIARASPEGMAFRAAADSLEWPAGRASGARADDSCGSVKRQRAGHRVRRELICGDFGDLGGPRVAF